MTRVVAAMGHAFGEPWVRRGTLATVLIVLGSLTPAYLPQNSPWWVPVRAIHLDGLQGKVIGTVFVLAGLLLLIQAWLALRSRLASLDLNAVLVWWSLPLVGAPPVFSHDAYSYAAQGWLIHNGLNPYEVGPGALPGAFADQSPWVWRFTPTPYGPLSLQIQHLIVEACGRQPYLSAMMMRVPALVGVVLIAVFLPKIADVMGLDRKLATWLGVLNPILVTDFVGGAHNDSHMVGLTVLGIWLAFRYRPLLGAAVVGVAATIKQPALLAAYAIAFVHHPLERLGPRPVLRQVGRVLACCGVALAVFAGISVASGYGFGWLNAVGVPGSVLTISPFTIIGQGIQLVLNALELDPTHHNAIRYARTAGMLVAAGIVAWLALTKVRRKPMNFLSWSYIAVALCGPALHGWYMMWGGVFLPLTRPSRRVERVVVWASVLLLSYAAINLSWRNGNTALGVAALAVGAWLVTHHHRTSTSQEAAHE